MDENLLGEAADRLLSDLPWGEAHLLKSFDVGHLDSMNEFSRHNATGSQVPMNFGDVVVLQRDGEQAWPWVKKSSRAAKRSETNWIVVKVLGSFLSISGFVHKVEFLLENVAHLVVHPPHVEGGEKLG